MATGLILLVGFTLPGNLVAKLRPRHGILALIFSDWLVHLAGLAIFTLVLAWDVERRKRENQPKLMADPMANKNMNKKMKNPSTFPYLIVAAFSLAYALLIEILQIFIPYRAFDLKDLLFDAVGITIVLAGIYFLKEKRLKPVAKYS